MSNETKAPLSMCQNHSGISARVDTLEESDRRQWDVIDKIQNRPPAWVTLVVSILLAGCTFAFTYAALL
jgi:hypothetical protein